MLQPHGGKLVNRVLVEQRREKAIKHAKELPKIEVSKELARDIENIATGVFSPLEGFVVQEDYLNILHEKRLANDLPWSVPILLDVTPEEAKQLNEGDKVALWNNSKLIAVMQIDEKYRYQKDELAIHVFGTKDIAHPGVAKVKQLNDIFLGGKIDLIDALDSNFPNYHLKPIETRVLFKERGWKTVVGFQTRNVPHLGHEYVQKTALTFVDGIFINPIIGKKKVGDFKDEIILETYQTLIENYYLKDRAIMSILQTEMRYAGPREAIFHAIVRKNFGCTHFIVGRDHAGVGNFYKPYAAQEIFEEFPDLGIVPVFFREFFYCKRCEGVANEKTCPHDKANRVNFSGTKIREMLANREKPPREIMRQEIAEIILNFKNPFVE